MVLNRVKKSNKGSVLMMTILIMIIMSLLGIAIITVTFSNYSMAMFKSDLERVYYIAEAGVEQIADVLDDLVATVQEEAKDAAAAEIERLIAEGDPQVVNEDGTVNSGAVNALFDGFYLTAFKSGLRNTIGARESDMAFHKKLLNTSEDDGTSALRRISLPNVGSGSAVLERLEYDEDASRNTYTVRVVVRGQMDNRRRRINVRFSLLPEASETPYQLVAKVMVETPKIPRVLQNALTAKGNIISVGGTAEIDGNVVCFGTVPADGSSEDMDADGFKYGGIVAGWHDNMNDLGIDRSYLPNVPPGGGVAGSFIINGNAATLSYIHTLFGTSSDHSDIIITGDTFARAIKSESGSNFSVMRFNKRPDNTGGNVYVSDNLQLDSNNGKVEVNGNFYGFVDAGYETGIYDKSAEWMYKRTSSIVVNGDSELNLNGEVYVGGSVFLSSYINSAGHKYMAGIAAGKSGRRIGYAFRKNNAENAALLGNPENILYWFDGDMSPEAVAYNEDEGNIHYDQYYLDEDAVEMIRGRNDLDSGDNEYFPAIYRGVHFKGVWDNLWNRDDIDSLLYKSYVNTTNIRINHTIGGTPVGFVNGAIAANGKVYSPLEVKDPRTGIWDRDMWLERKKECRKAYYEAVKDLVAGEEDIFGVSPTKADVFGCLNTGKMVEGKLTSASGRLLFYSPGDVRIYYSGGQWHARSLANDVSGTINLAEGIIYAGGNIYIDASGRDFNFKGLLMASGSIVFKGDCSITYDKGVVEDVIADSSLSQFFNFETHMKPADEPIKVQRVSVRNIKILEWIQE